MVDYDNVSFKNIVVVSSNEGYNYVLNNILPLYSNFWIYQIDQKLERNELEKQLLNAIENEPLTNVIIFGIQNHSKLQIKTNRILILDSIIRMLAISKYENNDQIIAMIIQNFISQWTAIDRVPGVKNWMNQEWFKKGGLCQLLY